MITVNRARRRPTMTTIPGSSPGALGGDTKTEGGIELTVFDGPTLHKLVQDGDGGSARATVKSQSSSSLFGAHYEAQYVYLIASDGTRLVSD